MRFKLPFDIAGYRGIIRDTLSWGKFLWPAIVSGMLMVWGRYFEDLPTSMVVTMGLVTYLTIFAFYLLWEKSIVLISLSDPYIDKKEEIFTIRLKVENTGSNSILKECLVKLSELTPLPPGIGLSELDIPIAIPTEGQTREFNKGSFNLRPHEPKFITLFKFSSGNIGNPIKLTTENGQKSLPRKYIYKLNLIAYCEKGNPSSKNFGVFVDEDGNLRLR